MTRLLGVVLVGLSLLGVGYFALCGLPGSSKPGTGGSGLSFQRVEPPHPTFGRIRGRCRLERPVARWEVPGTKCQGGPVTMLTESVVASEDGGLGGCIVALANPPKAAPPAKDAQFTLRTEASGYSPHVGAARAPVQLVAVNSTACDFCVHGYENVLAVTRFNFALAPRTRRDDLESAYLDHAAVVLLRDDCHATAGAWLHVFEHPWFDVTTAEPHGNRAPGEFLLVAVPPGDHEVVAWHEPMTRTELRADGKVTGYAYPAPWTSPPAKVHVTGGDVTTVDFVVPVPDDIPAPPALHDPHRAR